MAHHAIPCHMMSHHTRLEQMRSCHIEPHHAIPSRTMTCPIIPYHIMSCASYHIAAEHTIPNHKILSFHAIPCNTIACCGIPFLIISISHRIMSYHIPCVSNLIYQISCTRTYHTSYIVSSAMYHIIHHVSHHITASRIRSYPISS